MTIPEPREVAAGDRIVGLYEYGDSTGAPVLVFHGTPACGAGFDWADEPARAAGIRLLAPDRPGVGRSTPVAGWTVQDYPAMVDDLVGALGIDRFGVWGYSGGGPYAVATATLLPHRVAALAVVAGMGQVGVWATADDFAKTDRQLLELAPKHPFVARCILGATGRLARLSPGSATKSFLKELAPADLAVVTKLGSPQDAMALFTQAFGASGARGVVDDYRAIAQPWNIDLDAITCPTRIWHGTADTMVPPRHSDELAARIAGAELVAWPDEGHLGTVTHTAEIVDWLARYQ